MKSWAERGKKPEPVTLCICLACGAVDMDDDRLRDREDCTHNADHQHGPTQKVAYLPDPAPDDAELNRRGVLAEAIRRCGNGHRLPVALYRAADDTEPCAVGIVSAIETDGVRIAGGTLVPWVGLARVSTYRGETG